MKRIEFAKLAEISPAMVTKYDSQGLIVFAGDDDVDALATLEALAGRLDETKRAAALGRLGASARVEAQREAVPRVRSAKQELDELKRDTLQLELARKAGELVPVEVVERVVLDAIAALQSASDLEAGDTANQLTIDLGLSPDRTAVLKRRLRTFTTRVRARFAGEMLKLASEETASAARATEGDRGADASGARV
jgi:DNA-binding transcriptional MerR regulator